MEQQTNKAATASAIALIVGLIVGFVIGWYWYKGVCQKRDLAEIVNTDTNGDDNMSASSTDQTSNTTVPQNIYGTVSGQASVTVQGQKAGSQVTIGQVETSNPTWIAVREVVNGTVGNILGARLVASTASNVSVNLLRATKAGQTYKIFLYQDDGYKKFNFQKDKLVTSNDIPVGAEFVAQ
jgi:hypothetical protein